MTIDSGWSCRCSPTPGESTRHVMPSASSSRHGPMPENDLAARADVHGARHALDVGADDTCRVVLTEAQRRHPRVEVEVQIVALVAATRHDRVHVRHRRAAAAAVVRVVRNVKEADRALEAAAERNLRIHVLHHRSTCHRRASGNPVAHDVVAVVLCDRLDLHLEAQRVRHERRRVPVRAPIVVAPCVEVSREGKERNQRVVRGAAAEHARARMEDVRVATRLRCRLVSVVELAVEQFEPAAQIEHAR